ncbi:hypothetical protein AYL99_10983 [Fonsecaea erecta]|uniref:Heterokaryon incompatibility domain-containing protein n=1 Tax=Fonsecaea erecta TaxID=1367422 RepID=A0A178Z652_9EURO|nr:hypothetical protein AYL99_10983 [Fonsecaea erecta]OAP54535.1 hypothetical protein AYL99_10983 [Fonsecaea erecta]
MEHLLAPDGAARIDIPYIETQEFEAHQTTRVDVLENFKSYIERSGWQRNPQTGDVDFSNRSPREILQHLQTWLYFGCLVSVFRKVGVTVCTGDFLDSHPTRQGQRVVCTNKLQGFVGKWAQYEGFATGPVVPRDFSNPKYLRGENIKEILNYTFWYLGVYGRQIGRFPEPYRCRAKLIELSIMAMGESLCSALTVIYGYESSHMPTWGPSPVLDARLKRNGWCPSDSPFFPESMTKAAISADYYFGGRRCPWDQRDHSTCGAAICNQYLEIVEQEAYKQIHSFKGCPCARVPVPSSMTSLVDQGQIPVVHWDGNKLHVSAVDAQTKYVAISHVWSDGLGTDYSANALPACQLSRLQSLVHELYAAEPLSVPRARRLDGMVPFWLDSLCVPVGTEYENLRTKAIGKMAEIYRQADRVLVLDSHVLKLPRSADMVDKFLQIHLSKWHHRLWTMQEGHLARSLFFQFQDGAQSLHDMGETALQSLDRYAPESLCSPVRLLCATELEAFYRYFEVAKASGTSIQKRMRSCAKYLRSRQTSRLEDESVCVANILDLDAAKVLVCKDSDMRMARFYDLVGQFDPQIIFHDHPRLPLPGYRWAPRSFLHQLSDFIPIREGGGVEDNALDGWLIPGAGGLPVRFPGFEFGCHGLPPVDMPFLVRASNLPIHLQWTFMNKSAWWACTYELKLTEMLPGLESLDVRPIGGHYRRYVVILPVEFHPDALPVKGIVGIMDPNVPPHPMMLPGTPMAAWTTLDVGLPGNQRPCYSTPNGIPIQYLGRVHVSLPAAEAIARVAPFGMASAYGREQECIVLVHGLAGDALLAWKSPATGTVWPQDELPFYPGLDNSSIRVLSFGYNANPVTLVNNSAGINTIDDNANNLLGDLVDLRGGPDAVNRPVIFVGHNYGGLVIMNDDLFWHTQALNISHTNDIQGTQPELAAISKANIGVLFLGTPHKGSDPTVWAHVQTRFSPLQVSSYSLAVMAAISTGSPLLASIEAAFTRGPITRMEVFSFFEGQPSRMNPITLPPFQIVW